MTLRRERTALQAAIALACIVPLAAAGAGIAAGARWLQPLPTADMDSHFRYLSGIFVAMGLGFASCIPAVERKSGRLRLLGAMVIAGGLARLWSLAAVGVPSIGHLVGLGIELGVVPLVLGWQTRVAHLYRTRERPAAA